MNMITSLRRVPVISALLFVVSATASVIDFNTLTGANGDPFSTYSENGFTVTAIQGSWSRAFLFGNPIPAIFCNQCAPGTVAITDGGAPFTFASVDLGNAQSSVDTFIIQGFRLGSMVFSQSGSLTLANSFQTFASIDPTVLMDNLTISLTSSASLFDYNIDNIVVDAVPEPGTVVLVGIALTVATWVKIKNRQYSHAVGRHDFFDRRKARA
jgi:hypothetical protein